MESKMDFDIHQLRIFIEVVRSGSFSKAAEILNLSQSAVSQSIGKLEKQLNLTLIDRVARPFQLTKAGRLLLDRSQTILHAVDTLSYDIKLIDGQRPNLRIACCGFFGMTVFPLLVESLLKHVDQLRGFTGHTPTVCQMLQNRTVDMAISSSPMSNVPTVQSVPLYDESFLIVAPREVSQPIRTHHDLKVKLGHLPLIRYNDSTLDYLEIERILRYCEIDSDKRVQMNMDAATMELVAQGYGWSIMPSSGIWSVRHYLNSVQLLNLPEFKFSRKIYLNYQDSSLKSLADLIEKETKHAIQNSLLPEMVKADTIFQKAFIFAR